jgi:hypothetical protein
MFIVRDVAQIVDIEFSGNLRVSGRSIPPPHARGSGSIFGQLLP